MARAKPLDAVCTDKTTRCSIMLHNRPEHGVHLYPDSQAVSPEDTTPQAKLRGDASEPQKPERCHHHRARRLSSSFRFITFSDFKFDPTFSISTLMQRPGGGCKDDPAVPLERQDHVFSSSKKKLIAYLVSAAGVFSPLSSNIYLPALDAVADVLQFPSELDSQVPSTLTLLTGVAHSQ